MKNWRKGKKKVLITGGCGFIGSHVVEHFKRKTNWEIVVIDKLSYASNGLNRLRNSDCIPSDRIKVFPVDFTLPFPTGLRQEIGEDVNIILHMGAESHVDNSIKEPRDCFKNNIDGTVEMLEYAKTLKDLEFSFILSLMKFSVTRLMAQLSQSGTGISLRTHIQPVNLLPNLSVCLMRTHMACLLLRLIV